MPHQPSVPAESAWSPTLGGLRGAPIVLGSDGSAAARAAAFIAVALADARGALPHVVRAFDTTGVGMPGPLGALIAAADTLIGPHVHDPDVRAVHAELASLAGHPVDWPVHVGLGSPAWLIVREAAAIGAALIVMGLRRHGGLDRMAHHETTLNVMRAATCPVLGVTPSLTALPRCAVVGVDFSPATARVVRAALAVLGDGGTLVLAFVEPIAPDTDPPDEHDADAIVYALGVDAAFDRLVTDLGASARATVERVRIPADRERRVAEELLALAELRGADLLAVASRRHAWLDRALLGSVTSDLARDGRHALLVVPPPPAAAAARRPDARGV